MPFWSVFSLVAAILTQPAWNVEDKTRPGAPDTRAVLARRVYCAERPPIRRWAAVSLPLAYQALPLSLLNAKMPSMTERRTLALVTSLLILAFAVRITSLDAQSMWRDEIDTVCFALDFWELVQHAVWQGRVKSPAPSSDAFGSSAASANDQPRCQPTPGLSRVDPRAGLWSTLRTLLTLPGWNGPLYTIAMRPWIDLTGYSPFALRYSSLLLGLLAVPLTFVAGRRILDASTGLISATLVALSPHLVWYSQEAKMYGAILFLGLLAIYALRRAVDQNSRVSLDRGTGYGRHANNDLVLRPQPDGLSTYRLAQIATPKSTSSRLKGLIWWAVAVVATTLALYTHILTALLIPLQAVLGLIWWPRTRRHWRSALLALGCLTLPYLPLLAWQARNWLLPAGKATLFTLGRLDVMLEATFDGWGGQFVEEPWATLVLAGLAILALFGLTGRWLIGEDKEATGSTGDPHPSREENGWRESLALLAWIVLPILGIWLISARQPIFTNRYLIWAAPGFYLLAGVGGAALARLDWRGAVLASALLLVVLVGDGRALVHQAAHPIKPDFRAAADYLDTHYQPGDLIVFHLSYMVRNFDFYFDREYKGWGAPAPAGVMSNSDVDFYMRANTSGYESIWLVLSEAQMWDPNGQIKAWLDAHAAGAPEEQAFAHVSVYRYRLSNER